jgi:hypothetical protein
VWDLTLGLATVGYVLFVLFGDIDSPLLGMALIILVGHELLQTHLNKR